MNWVPACWVQLKPPTPQYHHRSLSMHDGTKDTVNSSSTPHPIFLSEMRLSSDGVAVQLRSLQNALVSIAPI